MRLKPEDIPWTHEIVGPEPFTLGALSPHEQRLEEYQEKLTGTLPDNRNEWDADAHKRELTFQLLDFHRRAEKPLWWAMFSRQDLVEDELIDDIECLGGLSISTAHPPYPDKRSIVYTCSFPEQETKLKSGDRGVCVQTLGNVSDLTIDEEQRIVSFRYAARLEQLGERISIGPGGPISSKKITEALFRYADSVIQGDDRYPAIGTLLNHEEPHIIGHLPKTPIIDESLDILPQIIEAVANLQESCPFYPGTSGFREDL